MNPDPPKRRCFCTICGSPDHMWYWHQGTADWGWPPPDERGAASGEAAPKAQTQVTADGSPESLSGQLFTKTETDLLNLLSTLHLESVEASGSTEKFQQIVESRDLSPLNGGFALGAMMGLLVARANQTGESVYLFPTAREILRKLAIALKLSARRPDAGKS